METLKEKVGEQIKNIREEKGLSQEEFGYLTFLTKQEVGEVERGIRTVNEGTYELIGNLFQVSSTSLREGKISPTLSRNEISKALITIQNTVLKIKEDHDYLISFLKEIGIQLDVQPPGKQIYSVRDIIKGPEGNPKEAFVVYDTQSGEVVKEKNKPEQFATYSEAKERANRLNREGQSQTGAIVGFNNKGIDLVSEEEILTFLPMFGYRNPRPLGDNQYQVDTIGEELPAVTVLQTFKEEVAEQPSEKEQGQREQIEAAPRK
ncbi:helix-turn-helix domain-containing protein [Ohessyouella blattaphilus]|uniref:helix-turn-helix domain-containing protein n=1 Tax=Ohessyouella blattaphilus TaxID=2949333 RepID=UPI003E230F8C